MSPNLKPLGTYVPKFVFWSIFTHFAFFIKYVCEMFLILNGTKAGLRQGYFYTFEKTQGEKTPKFFGLRPKTQVDFDKPHLFHIQNQKRNQGPLIDSLIFLILST